MGSIPVSAPEPAPLLAVEGLKVHFHTRDGVVRAVDGVDFQVGAGQTLGIVGESGSGKTVASLTLLRLAPPPARIMAGRVVFEGENLLLQSDKRLAQIRGRRGSGGGPPAAPAAPPMPRRCSPRPSPPTRGRCWKAGPGSPTATAARAGCCRASPGGRRICCTPRRAAAFMTAARKRRPN